MAIRQRGARAESSGLLAAVVRSVLVVGFTGVETVALVVWLGLVADAPTVSRATALGLGVLAIGLVVEHVLTDAAVNGVDRSFPVGTVVAISLSETALWAVWLLTAERIGGLAGLAAAAGVLAVLLVPQHTVEDNVLRGEGFLSDLVDLGTVGFSLVESVAATGWLLFVTREDLVAPALSAVDAVSVDPALVGVGALAVGLLVEHSMGVRFSRRG